MKLPLVNQVMMQINMKLQNLINYLHTNCINNKIQNIPIKLQQDKAQISINPKSLFKGTHINIPK